MPFTHLDRDGNAHMVDVGDKSASRREAVASARVSFPPDVYAALRESGGPNRPPTSSRSATRCRSTKSRLNSPTMMPPARSTFAPPAA